MTDDKSKSFLLALRQAGYNIPHFADGGGTALTGPTQINSPQVHASGMGNFANTYTNPLGILGGSSASVGNQLLNPVGGLLDAMQNNFQATGVPLQAGTNLNQLNQAYNQSQTGLGSQQDFLNALQAQNGIRNQSNVYNQLQGVANGTGPNPAKTQLAQATAANTANQAALMAGQRGAGANPALIARQAAQQGAANQQNAALGAANMEANQRLNALNQLGGIAQNQVNQQGQATQGLNTAAQNEQNILQGANSGFNTAQANQQMGINQINAGTAGANASGVQGLLGNVLGAVGGVASSFLAGGGEVPSQPTANVGEGQYNQIVSNGPQSGLGQALQSSPGKASSGVDMAGAAKAGSAIADLFAKGGKVPAMVSPGEQYIPPKDVPKIKAGKNPLEVGEKIPGKPKVKGDSYENDVIPKTLESGGIVIPNSVMQSKNAPKKASEFVKAYLTKGGKVPRMK